MPYIDKPIDRDQIVISSLDAMVDGESTARVIDCFVDHLDLEELGFDKAEPSFEGRPCYDPASMLKLYLYGYRNNIRSSRKLAAGCNVNIEIMWLMGGLTPDFRTISDFRKDNIDCLKKVFREFVRRVTVDLETGMDVSYNVQTAVDSETHMIMEYHATNHPTDHGQITPTMEHLKEKAGDKILEAVADQGYQQPEDIIRCLENGIIPNVIPPDGSDTYELEIAYAGRHRGSDKTHS